MEPNNRRGRKLCRRHDKVFEWTFQLLVRSWIDLWEKVILKRSKDIATNAIVDTLKAIFVIDPQEIRINWIANPSVTVCYASLREIRLNLGEDCHNCVINGRAEEVRIEWEYGPDDESKKQGVDWIKKPKLHVKRLKVRVVISAGRSEEQFPNIVDKNEPENDFERYQK